MCKFKAEKRGRPSLSSVCVTCGKSYAEHKTGQVTSPEAPKPVQSIPEEPDLPIKDTLRPLTPDEESAVNWYMDTNHPGWRSRRAAQV